MNDAPPTEYVPAAHGFAVSDAVPAGHFVHVAAPAAEYVPAMQLTHDIDDVAPAVAEYVPATQVVHVADEFWKVVAAEYVPAAQRAQPRVMVVSW